MSDGLLLLALVLASYRAFRFLGLDGLPGLEDARRAVERRLVERGTPDTWTDGARWAAGLGCGWCLGFWCAVATVGVTWAFRPLPLPGLWFMAVPAGVGLLGAVVEKLEDS